MDRRLLFFLLSWTAIAVLQAACTDLANDEAYYWIYSNKLAWGYFDHPPVIALFIKIGYFLVKQELGIRLITVLSQVTALYLIIRFLLPESTNPNDFIKVALIIPLLHVFSFIAVPDAPLFLSTTIFLVLFKRYSDKPGISLIIPLAASMAVMMYSKYHAALVILLVMFSKPGLWKDWRWMSACVLGAILFSPHLWWQYQHDFPSLKYHLIDRNRSFASKDVAVYLMNQLINFNPILFSLLAIRLFKKLNYVNDLERALHFIFVGFLVFFLLMTWRGHIEPQWTYVLVVPILYFSVIALTEREKGWIWLSAWVIIPLIIAGRFFLIFDLMPLATEFHGYPELTEKIKTAAEGKPVVIMNSYQLTSKYSFYAGESAVGMITDGRRNQYSICRDEAPIIGKDVLLVSRREQEGFKKLNEEGWYPVWVKQINNFSYYENVTVKVIGEIAIDSGKISIPVKIFNPYSIDLNLDESRELVVISLRNGKVHQFFKANTHLTTIESGKNYVETLIIELGEFSTDKQWIIGIRSKDQFFTFNSQPFEINF